MRAKALGIQKHLITVGSEVTIDSFTKHWNGVKEKERMLLEIFQHHNDQVKELIGRQYSPSTHKRYETSLEHTRRFIAEYYKQSDLSNHFFHKNHDEMKKRFIILVDFSEYSLFRFRHHSNVSED